MCNNYINISIRKFNYSEKYTNIIYSLAVNKKKLFFYLNRFHVLIPNIYFFPLKL